MNDSWCLGVTHFAQQRGGEQGGRAPGEICSGQHKQHRAGAGLRRLQLLEGESGGKKKVLKGSSHHPGEG